MSEVTTSAPVDSGAGAVETQTQGSVNPNPDAADKAAGSLSLKEKFKLQVDGEEIEDEVDWNDKEGLKRKLQLAAAAKKRMGEASSAKKKAFEIVNAFENDPSSLLSRMGPKGREIAEKYLLAQIKEDMLSPEEKSARTEKEELEALRKEKKDREEKSKKDAEAKTENEYAQKAQNTIIEALKKSGLPKSQDLVRRMAKIMHTNVSLGLDLTADDLVVEVKKEIVGMLKSVVGDSDGDSLLALLGDDVAKKIRSHDVQKLREKQSAFLPQSRKETSIGGGKTEDRPMTIEEWKEQVAKRVST